MLMFPHIEIIESFFGFLEALYAFILYAYMEQVVGRTVKSDIVFLLYFGEGENIGDSVRVVLYPSVAG